MRVRVHSAQGTCFSGTAAIWNQATSSLCAYFWTEERRVGQSGRPPPHPPAARQARLRRPAPAWLGGSATRSGASTGSHPSVLLSSIRRSAPGADGQHVPRACPEKHPGCITVSSRVVVSDANLVMADHTAISTVLPRLLFALRAK